MNALRSAAIAVATLVLMSGCTPPSTPDETPTPTEAAAEPSPTAEEPTGPLGLADGVLVRISAVAVAPTGERLTLALEVNNFIALTDAPTARRTALLEECAEFIAARGLGPDGGPVLDESEWAAVSATLTATGDDWPADLQIQAAQTGRIFTGVGGAISPMVGGGESMGCDRPILIAGAGVTSLFSATEAFLWAGGVDGALDLAGFSIVAESAGILLEECTIELSPLAMEHDDLWVTPEDTTRLCRIGIERDEND